MGNEDEEIGTGGGGASDEYRGLGAGEEVEKREGMGWVNTLTEKYID